MSLINDALKKAQRQRDEGTPAPTTEAPSTASSPEQLHRVVRREKPAGFRSQLMLIGGGALVTVLLLVFGAVFLFRSPEKPAAQPAKPAPTAVAATPAVVAPPAAAAVPPAVAPVAPAPAVVVQAAPPAATPVSTAAPVPQVQVAAATAPVASPTASPAPSGQFSLPPAPAPDATSAPVAASTSASSAPASTERPKASTRMIGVIEHFRVGGIRMAGAESKVLMNDKVYRLNDIVDYELNIRLTNIEAKALTFEDSRGAIHVRTF